MEEDEMEMSKEELQKWIREKIKKNYLISTNVLEKYKLLQTLLDRREKQAAHLLKLCESVSACEAIVRKQYSLLGWQYRDTYSDEDDDTKGSGNAIPSSTTNGLTPLLPKQQDKRNMENCKQSNISLKRKPVVVLTRISTSQISSLCPPRPQNQNCEDDSLNNSDCNVQWEPLESSSYPSDSDYSVSSDKTWSSKRRKKDQKNPKCTSQKARQASTNTDAESNATKTSPQASTNTDAESNATKTSPQASTNTDAESNATKTSPQASTNTVAEKNATKPSKLQASTNTDATCNVTKTSTMPSNSKVTHPVCIVTTPRPTTGKDTKTPPNIPPAVLKVNMSVLARRKAMSWQQGKILEIVTKEDGRLKYKINFEEKKKTLFSGHHIAFDYMPKIDELFVGARVVVKFQDKETRFCPGVLAELPSRKNRMRFLVFIDDHTPVYVGLPLLHLVCRPSTYMHSAMKISMEQHNDTF
ncbi:histone-lysine N-methyltransferase SETDB1-A-like isoform X2 [Etheostoma cragini]|uniref:histone-lysine N-methyltransferase SETDB1-A-like isoform X2 n=1 Tax=Etheostoma cragini TaxID=417921 RepID=UPI00155E6E25|nr:histone-lysine N-methyltransferase SETDB1-A-like isoform X2 [Etheostoma cragini]